MNENTIPPVDGTARCTTDGKPLEQSPDDVGQHKNYVILCDDERAKGFVRPVRNTYVHQFMEDGSEVPYPLVTRKGIGGCGVATRMGQALSETYARDPKFYSHTFCVGCNSHLPVAEFTWEDHSRVGS